LPEQVILRASLKLSTVDKRKKYFPHLLPLHLLIEDEAGAQEIQGFEVRDAIVARHVDLGECSVLLEAACQSYDGPIA